jgi:hypothetical protein
MKSHFMLNRGAALACAVTGATTLLPDTSLAQTYTAADYATNAAYADGWQQGDNGGFGFTAWSMNLTYASAIQHDMIGSASPYNPFGLAWTLYNPNGLALGTPNPPEGGYDISRVGRGFPALQVGQTISTVFANPAERGYGYAIRLVSGGGNVGFYNCHCPQPFERLVVGAFGLGGGSSVNAGWYVQGGAHFDLNWTSLFDTNTASGTRLDVTMAGTNRYKVVMTPLNNPSVAYTNVGRLLGRSRGSIDWIQFDLFNTDSDFFPTAVADPQLTDFYISSITITDVQPVPPEIINPPLSKILYPGRTTRFEVESLGNNLSYQWRKNGTNLADGGNIPGAQSSRLVINNISEADVGDYTVVITNSVGAVTSSPPASLSLAALPTTPYEAAVVSANPVAYWRLNETDDPASGAALAHDYAGGYDGRYGSACSNKFNGVFGPLPSDGLSVFEPANGAMRSTTNKPRSQVTLPPLNFNSDTITVAAWIYPIGPQCDTCHMISSIDFGFALSYGAQQWGDRGQLRYVWNTGGRDTAQFVSGLTIPENQWSFVALVIDPTKAVLYLKNASGQAAATNAIPHYAQPWAGELMLGGPDRLFPSFNGKIDEVAIFNRALSAREIQDLYNGVEAVHLSIQSVGSNLVLTWPEGMLLESANVSGPWVTNNATSPYTFAPTGPKKFYRVQVR